MQTLLHHSENLSAALTILSSPERCFAFTIQCFNFTSLISWTVKIFLWGHVVAGHLALMSGLVVMIAKKGGKRHKNFGRIFYYSMWLVSITAVTLSVYKNSTFLLHVGLFVLYQNYAGKRAQEEKSLRFNPVDMANSGIALVNTLFMVLSGQIVLLVFGGISAWLILLDITTFLRIKKGRPVAKNDWLKKHIGMMMGAYIGTLTAFLVVNVPAFQPNWLIWLAPTLILVPLMQYWTHKFTKKPVAKDFA